MLNHMNRLGMATIALPEIETEEVTGEVLLSDTPWHVVLLDDDVHTFEYVIEMLCHIFNYSVEKAVSMTVEVHNCKRVIVATCHIEKAEARQQQIHDYGPDWRIPDCKGSMTAVLERQV